MTRRPSATAFIRLRSVPGLEHMIIQGTTELCNYQMQHDFASSRQLTLNYQQKISIPRHHETLTTAISTCAPISVFSTGASVVKIELEGPKLSPCSAKDTSGCKGTDDQEIQQWNLEKRCKKCEVKHREEENEEEEAEQQKQ